MKIYFISGTDTGCGKTYITCQLLNYLKQNNKKALALKPVASGCEEGFLNEDVINLQRYNQDKHQSINGWSFVPPISPHLAAAAVGCNLGIKKLAAFCLERPLDNIDYLLIEGAGGLLAPLNSQESWLDFIIYLQIPVILVVGMRLGCLNHALLSDTVLKINNIKEAGWIANCLDKDMLALEDNILTLKQRMTLPFLGAIEYDSAHFSSLDNKFF